MWGVLPLVIFMFSQELMDGQDQGENPSLQNLCLIYLSTLKQMVVWVET